MNEMERLRELYRQVTGKEEPARSWQEADRLQEDLGLTSVSLLYMALAVEQEFGVSFTNEDLMTLQTVGDVLKKIRS